MRWSRAAGILAACATLPLAGATEAGWPVTLPRSTLAIRTAEGWTTFWRSDSAPARWLPDVRVMLAVAWRPGAPGVTWAEIDLAGSGAAWRTRVVLARIDPARVRLELQNGVAPDGQVAVWTLASAPPEAVMAVNAGQFAGGAAWGWVVHDGVEYRPPGRGPLAVAVVTDTLGRLEFLDQAALEARRAAGRGGRPTGVEEAFQSYPVLLENGAVPEGLRRPSPYINLAHRDIRLALGIMPDSTLLLALTRFDGLGGVLGGVPFGLTLPEMAAVMGALGSRSAVGLDGGISAQLLVRDHRGKAHTWEGLRRVPLALLALPR